MVRTLMGADLSTLWLRVAGASRKEIERLRSDRPELEWDEYLDHLLAERWPLARRAAIESRAKEAAGDGDARYGAPLRRLNRNVPEDYPFPLGASGVGA